MGKGNVCVFNPYEGLFYIDNADINFYRRTDDEFEEPELMFLREISYDDFTSGAWDFDENETICYQQEIEASFQYAVNQRFPSFIPCRKWIGHSQLAILENNLFYIVFEDNEWSIAVELIQKEYPYYDYSGLQKTHYQRYLHGIRDSLFEQFDSLGIYESAWTHGVIHRR